jgi:hypothetical protein
MNTLTNPYKGNPVTTIQASVGDADIALIKGIAFRTGIIDQTASILWKKLCDALRRANITDYARLDDYIRYLNELEFPDARGPEPFVKVLNVKAPKRHRTTSRNVVETA